LDRLALHPSLLVWGCKSTVLLKKLQVSYTVKASFGPQTVTFSLQQIFEYFKNLLMEIPKSVTDIMLEMLSDETTQIVVNTRGQCISIKM